VYLIISVLSPPHILAKVNGVPKVKFPSYYQKFMHITESPPYRLLTKPTNQILGQNKIARSKTKEQN